MEMDIAKLVQESNSYADFNEVQHSALKEGLLQNNMVVASPTASGKTTIAEIAALHSILNKKRKVVYTCPLRALASEHFQDFKRKYEKKFGLRITLSTGDFDSSSKYLSSYDLIFTTNEKLDSLTRHHADWLQNIGLLVIDEIHMLGTDRGPVVEVLITKMRSMVSDLQLLALSATIPNADEIGEWLNAKVVKSNFRPVELKECIFHNPNLYIGNSKNSLKREGDYIETLMNDTLQKEKQALIIANTRKRSESFAHKLTSLTSSKLTENEKLKLKKASEKIKNTLEIPTEQCRNLASLIEKGAAFHNAGIMSKQRKIIEDLFREGTIKVISATPTLAAGVNLPAFRVIIPSLYRYTHIGQQRISVMDYKQIAGRAGRPKYDTEGQSIIIARNEFEIEDLQDLYINGKVEEITSRLGIESVLRTHVLAAIATNYVYDLESMERFFQKTFYAKQYKDLKSLFLKINEILIELEEKGFLKSDEKRISATEIGKRVSELYLDPLSAHQIIEALKQSKSTELFYLYTIANTYEMIPFLPVAKAKEAELWELVQENAIEIPVNVETEMFMDESMLPKYNLSLLLKDWVHEVSEQNILETFKVQPGILHSKLRITDWIVYCCFELAKALKLEQHYSPLAKMRKRLKHGVREDLIALTELRGIGRVRARKLHRANLKGVSDLKKTDVRDLSKILPPAVALKVKKQLGQN